MPLDFHRRLLQNPRMAYDEKAAGIVREIEQALEGGWTNTAHAEALRLSGGILNAIELQVEEDGPPPAPMSSACSATPCWRRSATQTSILRPSLPV